MPIGYATAKINITSFVVDGIDSDDLPDDMPLTAKMTLTPMIQAGRTLSYNDNGETKLKAVMPITVDIGNDGSIDHFGRDYVKLVAPTAVETNLARLQWRATFSNIRLGGVATSVVIDPIYFWVDPGVAVNIADHVNVAASTAVSIARGARGFGIAGAFANEDGDLVLQYETDSGVVESDPLPISVGLSPEVAAATFAPVSIADKVVEINEGQASAAANAARMLSKLNRGIDNVNLLYVGDSTGNETNEHIYLETQALAAQFPKYTVQYRLWNDTSRVYETATTVQTGTGTPPVLTVWNCSVSGFATFHFVGERFTQAFEVLTPTPPDVIMVSHSHNMLDVSTPNTRASFRPNIFILTEELTQIFPDAGVILMSQNPSYTVGRETWQNIKATELQGLAARRGYGFIDVHQAFIDTGSPRDYVKADNIHPTTNVDAPAPNGSQLWADTVMRALQYHGTVAAPAQRASYFLEPGRSLIPNTEFADWANGSPPTGWTLTNVVAEKDTTNFETGAWGMKLTATADGTVFAQFSATPASLGVAGLVAGKLVTVGVRIFVPSTNTTNGVGLLVKDQTGSATQRRVDISSVTRGRFHWLYLVKRVESPGTLLTVQISPQWSGTNDGTHTMTVDRIRAVEGDLPRFA